MRRTARWALLGSGMIGALAAAFLAGRVLAGGIPATAALTYAGLLQDANGAPLTGSHNIQVALWAMASGGSSPLCQTTSTPIGLDGGRFSIALPDACTTAVQANAESWVEVLLDGATLGRTKLGAVPYAVEASHATAADNATAATNLTCPDPTAPGKYGFCIWHDGGTSSYTQTRAAATATCKAKGGRLCTFAEVSAAWQAGAEWCAFSWVADLPAVSSAATTMGYVSYPMQAGTTGCHAGGVSFDPAALTATYDANCCK
jgi:hypothetical protein